MHNSIKDYHRNPTYAELIKEAIIHPTETIKYPNIIATQLRNTPQVTRVDDDNCLDENILNSNTMKQNVQQTAVQRAMQPVARSIQTGLEQFDIYDTDETIQQQADDNAAELEALQSGKTRKDNNLLTTVEEEVTDPTQIDDMLASSYKSSIRGNLTGTSSSSAAIHPSTSSAASEELQDIPFEEVEEIPRDITMPDLTELAKQRILYIQQHVGDNTETSEIEAILLSIDEFKAFKHKKDRPAVTEYLSLKTSLINILNKSHWQTAGLPILSDKEGLDRAYTNNENLYYDGNETYI